MLLFRIKSTDILLIVLFISGMCFSCYTRSDLLEAYKNSDYKQIQALIDQGTDVDIKFDDDVTLIMQAARCGQNEMVSLFLKAKPDLEWKDKEGRTALSLACQSCSYDVAELLIDNGANFVLDRWDVSLLDYAVQCTDSTYQRLAALLIEKYEMKTKMPDRISAALFFADSIPKAQFLIANGANINYVDKIGRSPLGAAINPERVVVAEFLINQGASVNLKDRTGDGWTPLISAVDEGLTEIVELLLSKGADWRPRIKKGPFRGLNALGMARILASNDNEQFLEKLPLMARDRYSGDVFKRRQSEIVSILETAGAKR